MNKLLEQIISLDSYRPALLKLQQIDQAQTKLIETALTAATLETHNGMHEAENNGDRLRYWLYREAVEIKAHTSSYLSYSEMMATREANLWKFTLGSTDQFFETVFDELDTYFATKKNRMAPSVQNSRGERLSRSRKYAHVTAMKLRFIEHEIGSIAARYEYSGEMGIS